MIIEHAKWIYWVSSLLSLVCIVIQTDNQQSLKTCPFQIFAHITFFFKDLLHRKSVRYTRLQNYEIVPLTNLP